MTSLHDPRFLVVIGWTLLASACSRPDPATRDPEARDPYYPPALVETTIPSHGDTLNALLYLAAGEGPHPTAIFLHGLPGNERNLDLAQAVRRAGWHALYFHYRGAWGSGGEFSWEHAIEDALAAVAWLRSTEIAEKHRIDPARIALIGHSLGAWVALQAAARAPELQQVIALSPWNIGLHVSQVQGGHKQRQFEYGIADAFDVDSGPLRNHDPRQLARDLLTTEREKEYELVSLAARLSGKSLLLLSSSEDEKWLSGQTAVLESAYRKAGASVERLVVEDDHALSAHRIWLARTVIRWLSGER